MIYKLVHEFTKNNFLRRCKTGKAHNFSLLTTFRFGSPKVNLSPGATLVLAKDR